MFGTLAVQRIETVLKVNFPYYNGKWTVCNAFLYFYYCFIGEGSHGHQNGFDEHERCHPRYRQSLDARNRRGGGRTSRPVEGDRAHSNKKKRAFILPFLKFFCSFSIQFEFVARLNFSFFPALFFVHLPPPLLSLRSTRSIPFVFCILLFSGGKHLYPPTGRLNM